MDAKTQIETGHCCLGIELGSTRIKAVLIGRDYKPLASGGHDWENQQQNGIWTYSLSSVHSGLQAAYVQLKRAVQQSYHTTLKHLQALGISGMMHGYLAFDQREQQLAEFRTWRNNITGQAAAVLSELFQYNIPQRWSIAHLYQAIRNGEAHVRDVAFITTLAGYIHWQLSGQRVLGVGEASGMFPISADSKSFDAAMIAAFESKVCGQKLPWRLGDILPTVLLAGQEAGRLTAQGAQLLDPEGDLQAGIPLCPAEGDAGTGMVATNSVAVRRGNVSAGTSVFAMLVLERPLSKMHPEIDLVTTPDGLPVAMAHTNNCTSDYDAWLSLFAEAARLLGADFDKAKLYDTLLRQALQGDADCGGQLSYGYISGEHITGFGQGRPLFVRSSPLLDLANFMRCQLYSSLCTLRTGLDILFVDEGIQLDELCGHGGFFKTAEVGQRIMAAATNTPVALSDGAAEGGAWGIALLAAYLDLASCCSLAEFLSTVFATQTKKVVLPEPQEVAGFARFLARYHRCLPVEQTAVECLQ